MLIYQYLLGVMFILLVGSLKSIFPTQSSMKLQTQFGMSPRVFSQRKRYFNYYCVPVKVYCIFSNKSSISYKFKAPLYGHQIFFCFSITFRHL